MGAATPKHSQIGRTWRAAALARLAVGLTAAVALPAWTQLAIGSAPEAVYVVVASASRVNALEGKDLFDLYTGRLNALPGAAHTLPVELPRGQAARELFYTAIGSATPAQVDSHWARLLFSGRLRPPPQAADEADMLRRVKADPQSIGYVSIPPNDADVRVLLRLTRRPTNPGR